MCTEKVLPEGQRHKFVGGSLRMYFLHSGSRISVFEHNINIIKFCLFYPERVHKSSRFLNSFDGKTYFLF